MNKSDLEAKMEESFVKEQLCIDKLQRQVRTQVCSAKEGGGIWEGLNQMVQMIDHPSTSNGSTQETNVVQTPSINVY